MQNRISMITLGVKDLQASTDFYQNALNLPLSPHSVPGAVTFFELNGTWLGLFQRESLAKDANVPAEGNGFNSFTLSHNLPSEDDVKKFFRELPDSVEIVKEPKKADWGGYHGYFADLDGHLWEIAYNPDFWIGPPQ